MITTKRRLFQRAVNHDFVLAQAKHFADRATRDEPKDEDVRIQRLFRLAFARAASEDEVEVARALLSAPRKGATDLAWRDLAHVLLLSNEFIYLD